MFQKYNGLYKDDWKKVLILKYQRKANNNPTKPKKTTTKNPTKPNQKPNKHPTNNVPQLLESFSGFAPSGSRVVLQWGLREQSLGAVGVLELGVCVFFWLFFNAE